MAFAAVMAADLAPVSWAFARWLSSSGETDRHEDARDQDGDEQLDEREAVVGAQTGAEHVPRVVGGCAALSFRLGVSAGWPSRAGAWASRAASKRPVPSHHGQRTRCGSPPRPEISSPVPRQAVQVLGSCSVGALTGRQARSPAGATEPFGPCAGAADRRVGGLVARAASAASWAAPRGRSAGAAGRRRGTRSRRWRARRRGTARRGSTGTPSGERAASASSASGFIASLSWSGPSGLVNSSAPVGAASSSPSIVSAEPPVLVHSQPSMPCSRGTTAVAREPAQHREAARLAPRLGAGRGRPGPGAAARASAAAAPSRAESTSRVAPFGFIRSASGARRRPDSNAIVSVRPAPAPGGGGAEGIARSNRSQRAASPSSRSTRIVSFHSPSSRPWRRWMPTSVNPAARCSCRLAWLVVKTRLVSL